MNLYDNNKITKEELTKKLQGWFGYAQWANTYKFREWIRKQIDK